MKRILRRCQDSIEQLLTTATCFVALEWPTALPIRVRHTPRRALKRR